MENITKKPRNINIDIIKCIAVFLVISVHFLFNNGFYHTCIDCPRMYIMVMIRTFSLMCVPLFILITGYLMNKKELSSKYYWGLKKIIIPYLILSIITLAVRISLSKYNIFPKINYINSFIDFRLIYYAWYVDMYIGLFLLIPFINKAFTNKKNDTILITTLLFLTTLPTICKSPTFIISRWSHLWVITYYVIGAYIARYKIKFQVKNVFRIFCGSMLFFMILNCFINSGKVFESHSFDKYGGIENVFNSVLFFLTFISINFNLQERTKSIITHIAKISLGIYLSSFIFDNIYYHFLNNFVTDVTARLNWYIVIVPAVFISAVLLAEITDYLYKFIDKRFLPK